ncbi:3-isopropylmalate dehydrogenase [Polynucleobacter sp. SHI8]|uniref:isocitrate/isopropylmalate dehydrogenase family protein n=1 Tax=unclassified Polynucleobacter TaxID=2640945 RepID=UPI00248F50E9|nr:MULTISPECIES: isocitrate/isopropylmalate family dehydrogenase [unclassified Polynucleobacter]BDW10689.1 3-isopropylmalate dehydrogenase [Polynucleobacter sp. SHI2]BDW13135.1 3-isopropylmalate dehydrogenase [Polynucleobacter sp. SHI8]
MKIVVIPGDGIGPETMAVCTQVLEAVSDKLHLQLQLVPEIAGHDSLKKYQATVTPELLAKVKDADGLMLGPMATFDFKDESKGEINPSKYFRKQLDLYANIRPAKTFPNIPTRMNPFDLAVVRENTEGFYADRNVESGNSEILVTPEVGIALRRITRLCCDRIAKSAFELAMTRKKHVSIIHKANVLRITDGMFMDSCYNVAKNYPEVTVDEFIVDAMMAHVVRNPERFDTIVTTNMFGDILSDLTAELSGSLGLGGSLNAGDLYAMGQAAHGSAPDIAGKDIANPFSLITSASMLLNWLGQRHQLPTYIQAAKLIDLCMEQAIDAKETTKDIGGSLGTKQTGQLFIQRMKAA